MPVSKSFWGVIERRGRQIHPNVRDEEKTMVKWEGAAEKMSISVNLFYHGKNGNALKFAREMEESGIADAIRAEEGNLRYQYFQPLNDPETILLIDSWRDQAAIDAHHSSPMMKKLADLRDKYDLHMEAERFASIEAPSSDDKYLRK